MNGAGESAELVRGWNDVPLDDDGVAEAKRIAGKLAGAYDVDSLCTSTLKRAEQTARIISGACGVKPEPCDDLRTWNVGPSLVGKPVDEAQPKLTLYIRQDERVPPKGESFRTFRERAIGAVQDLLTKVKDGGTHVGVTHARVLQTVKAWIDAGRPADKSVDLDTMTDENAEPAPGGMMIVRPA